MSHDLENKQFANQLFRKKGSLDQNRQTGTVAGVFQSYRKDGKLIS